MSTSEAQAGREINFLGNHFYIDETVHRPRASTEFITRAGYITYLNQLHQGVVAADIGVGSGVTAISCALACPKLEKMYGVDLYENALKIAADNVDALDANAKIELLQGDLFGPLLDRPIDVIIANLPFASTAKIEEIRADPAAPSEPLSGMHGGETGFELYERFFKQLAGYEFMDAVLGIWVFCSAEHRSFVERYHQLQFPSFGLMAFRDKFKPHFAHFLFTRKAFTPGPDLAPLI